MKNLYGIREDITQQNFKNFMYDIYADRHTPYAFSSKGVIVLTDDYQLFETLRQQEANNHHRVRIFQDFGLGSGELSETTSLNDKWKNSIYFEQQDCTDLLTDRAMGGAHLLVLTDDAEKLKNYLKTVIDWHIKSCKISLDSKTWLNKLEFMACSAPTLYFYITIANNFSNVKFDNNFMRNADFGYYLSTKGDILNGETTIKSTIDKLVAKSKTITTD